MSERGLIIVESPAKARTLQRILGAAWKVRATGGHVRDLPEGRIAIDLRGPYTPDWQTVRGKGQVLQELAREARVAEMVILATDPDREGEAIAWHLAEELGLEGRARRARIREITPDGLARALAEAGALDRARYEAQLARRVVDRIVGFRLAPLLGDVIQRGLSAGRVQSVALRLLVERDQMRRGFRGERRHRVKARLALGRRSFVAHLDVESREQAERIAADLQQSRPVVERVEASVRLRHAPPPFVTARLQQEAFERLHFPLKKTMRLAQRLYEGVELGPAGPVSLITYVRTDSPRVGARAVEAARAFLADRFGAAALADGPVIHAPASAAQDAHEGIRPTAVELEPALVRPHLDRDGGRLYERIWRRFCASQMRPARVASIQATISVGEVRLCCTGAAIEEPGFLAVWGDDTGPMAGEDEEARALAEAQPLPALEAGMELALREVRVVEIEEEPPPAFTEASLLVELERRGIGRPSTWTQVVETLIDRGYATRTRGRIEATELGEAVVGLLLQAVPELVDPNLSARLEAELDAIEAGGTDWVEVVRRFHLPLEARLEEARTRFGKPARRGLVDRPCERCGAPLALRWGKNGPFLSCSTFPTCRFTRDLARPGDASALVAGGEASAAASIEPPRRGACPRCGAPLVERRGRTGPFLACSAYPACRTTVAVSTGVRCPACKEGEIAEKRSRRGSVFFGCNRYPDCTHVLRERPVPRPCPRCGAAFVVQRFSRRDGGIFACIAPGCSHREPIAEALAR